MKTIAIIDDDIYIGDMLEEVLVQEGYKVIRAYSGTEALYLLERNKPDLILLDLMLPGLSGEEVLTHIEEIPVIVLSAKVDVQDKVNLLLSGAVDYMTKPFDISELLARITVQLRRNPQQGSAPYNGGQGRALYDGSGQGRALYNGSPLSNGGQGRALYNGSTNHNSAPYNGSPLNGGGSRGSNCENAIVIGNLVLDTMVMCLIVQGKPVRLTRTEYAIIKLLMDNPKQVIARSVMLDRISLDTPDCTERSLKQHISNLRKKMQEAGGRDYIETVWGIGFKLVEQES